MGDVLFDDFSTQIDGEIRRLSALIVDLNNEHLEELNKQQIKLERKEKSAKRKKSIQDIITNDFLQLLEASKTDKDIKVPTAVMISGGVQSERDETIDWTRKQIDSRVIAVDLSENEEDAIYRIKTETDYAIDYYKKNEIRTVLFVNNFDRILSPKNVSSRTISELKDLLTDLSTKNAPLTIVFQARNVKNIDNDFSTNKARVPCLINLDKIEMPNVS